jgi:hypothetical protein
MNRKGSTHRGGNSLICVCEVHCTLKHDININVATGRSKGLKHLDNFFVRNFA